MKVGFRRSPRSSNSKSPVTPACFDMRDRICDVQRARWASLLDHLPDASEADHDGIVRVRRKQWGLPAVPFSVELLEPAASRIGGDRAHVSVSGGDRENRSLQGFGSAPERGAEKGGSVDRAFVAPTLEVRQGSLRDVAGLATPSNDIGSFLQ